MPALYTHTTRASGTILTASIYNSDHQNHITFGDAQYSGGWEATVAQMRIQTDPGEQGTESLGSSISDELEQLRFAIKECKQALDSSLTYWYESPVDLAGSGRFPPWYIDRLGVNIFPSSPGYVEVGAGNCRDAADTINMKVSTPLHRTVSGLWTTTVTGGGAGVTWAKFVPYHVFVVKTQASAFDIGFDTVLTASNLLGRVSGTKYRRIGSANTATVPGAMRTMVQYGDEFVMGSANGGNPSFISRPVTGAGAVANAAIKIIGLPTGLALQAHFLAYATAANTLFVVYDARASNQSFPDNSAFYGATLAAGRVQQARAWSNEAGELTYSYSAAAEAANIVLMGWRDTRAGI